RSLARSADDAARVVVHADEVEAPVVALELARAYEVRQVERGHVLWVSAPEERIEEPAVERAVHPARGLGIGLGGGRRIARRKIERDPDVRLTRSRAYRVSRGAVREQEVVRHEDRGAEIADARRVDAAVVACVRDHLGLVQRHPVFDPVTEKSGEGFVVRCVGRYDLSGRTVAPYSQRL